VVVYGISLEVVGYLAFLDPDEEFLQEFAIRILGIPVDDTSSRQVKIGEARINRVFVAEAINRRKGLFVKSLSPLRRQPISG
jgi:hypothetical protein